MPRTRHALYALSLLLTLSMLFSPPVAAEDEDDGKCPYDPSLTWDDFQGDPPEDSDLDALISTGVDRSGYTYTMGTNEEGQYTAKPNGISTSSYINKLESWVKPGSKTDALLQHEQYHLDISEIWAGKFEEEVKGLEGVGATAADARKDLDDKIAAADKKNGEDCLAEQERYDTETNHGTNEEKQKEWCDTIGEELRVEEPNDEKVRSGSTFGFDSSTGEVLITDSSVRSFESGGVEFFDDGLLGAIVELPSLFFEGFHMDDTHPMFAPDHENASVRFHGPDGVAFSGELRLLIAAGNRITGWLQNTQINPLALRTSPFLQLLQASLESGRAIVTVSIATEEGVEFRNATGNFSQSSILPVSIEIGTYQRPWDRLPMPLPAPSGPFWPLDETLD